MTPISFFVHGDPKGQPRPRAFARKIGNTFMARVYDAGTAEGWKSQVALAAKPFIPVPPLQGPLEISITLYFRRPKAHYTSKGLRETAPYWHTSKPDRDNCEKAILDALKTVGMFDDDCQVCCGAVEKRYGNNQEVGAAITICDAPPHRVEMKNERGERVGVVEFAYGQQPSLMDYPHHD